MKVARQTAVKVPPNICLQCFNAQQQFAFPFLVYCPHRQVLGVVRGPDEHATFECAPEQVEAVLAKLQDGQEGSEPAQPRLKNWP
jgi:hypothetical protein